MAPAPASRPARERLLDAAGGLFYESGIAATGVDAILARAGVSPATMYAHFAGKDGLVAAYLQQRHEAWQRTWDEVLAERDDAVERLLSVFDAVARFRERGGSRRGCGFLAAATELPAGHPGQRWLDADSRLLTGRLRDLSAAAGAGDPDDLAATLLLLYDGALSRYARGATTPGLPGGDPLARSRRLAREQVLSALGPGRAQPSRSTASRAISGGTVCGPGNSR
jgi:AcrR family transcriptional regulator